ncbi:Bromodomain-containing protein, partial [Dipodascopsis tothii]|uniref:Bromodomain-containing protein n=1 Tax=Dipodascopsis tothii TaxID=44089 RepID=UPI0034CDA44F
MAADKRRHRPSGAGEREAGESEAVLEPVGENASRKEIADAAAAIVRAVTELKDEDGRLVHKEFVRLPSRKLYPDYYQTIAEPISLAEIREKIKRQKYEDVAAAAADFALMCTNAKTYNQEESLVYIDAEAIEGRVAEVVAQLTAVRDPTAERNAAMAEIVDELTKLKTSARGRYYAELFMVEPDRKLYKHYYKIIKHPMAFGTVSARIEEGRYESWAEFEADVNLIFSNAFTFNEEQSDIYEDAQFLERNFRERLEERRAALPDTGAAPVKLRLSVKDDKPEDAAPRIKLSLGGRAEDEDEDERARRKRNKKRGRKDSEPVESPAPVEREEDRGPKRIRISTRAVSEPVADEDEDEDEDEPTPAPEPPASPARRGRPPLDAASPARATRGASVRIDAPVDSAADVLQQAGMAVPPPAVPKPPTDGATPPKPAEEARLRPDGKTVADALMTMFSISSAPRIPFAQPYSITFPPHKTDVFQSYTITLPATHNVVTISPTLSTSLLVRNYNLYMTLNGRRLSPSITAATNGMRRSMLGTDPNEPVPPRSYYDVTLGPGMNMIECMVHAAAPFGSGAPVPPLQPPQPGTPTPTPNDGSERERIVVWVLVQR